jgi:hypothetical protein
VYDFLAWGVILVLNGQTHDNAGMQLLRFVSLKDVLFDSTILGVAVVQFLVVFALGSF